MKHTYNIENILKYFECDDINELLQFRRNISKKIINLRNASLQNADLQYASLRNANLQNANLQYASLQNANLRNASLQNADLRNASLQNANLRNASLRNADLQNADLRNASLQNASLQNADLRNASLRNADLRNADLQYANLRNADLRNASLQYADLRNADLRNAKGMVKIMGVEIGNIYWKRIGDGLINIDYQYKIGINKLRDGEIFEDDERILCSFPGFHFASRSWCAVNYHSRPYEAKIRIPEGSKICEPWATDGKASADMIEILQVFDINTGDDVTEKFKGGNNENS